MIRSLLPFLMACAAAAQSIRVEATGTVGRRIENSYFVAELSPKTFDGKKEGSGALTALTFKEFGITLFRNPGNGLMHKGPSLQRAGARDYTDQGMWSPVQNFREERRDGVYIHRREGYFSGYPEVKVEAEYRVPDNAPYFIVSTVMAVEKPIRVVLMRNNEMTMNLFFTHVAWSGKDGVRRLAAFDERKTILETEPIPADVPWLAFVNPEKGYGYGFVALRYHAARAAHPETRISDGFVPRAELTTAQTVPPINGRYWSRYILSGEEVSLQPGDRFEERTAYILFHSSTDEPMGDFFDWEKKIRAKQ